MLRAYAPRYVVPYRRRSYYPRRKLKRLYRAAKTLRSIRSAQKAFRDEFQGYHPRGSEQSINSFGATYATANERQRRARKMFNYRGQGDYWSDFKKGGWFGRNTGMGTALRGLGGAIGSYAGSGGAALGTAAGGAVSKWLGFGDYTTPASGNQLMGDAQTPVTVNSTDDNTGDLYLSHTEFIGNVTASNTGAGSSSFQQTTYELNPGLVHSFPWLAQIAANFELYDFQGLMFQYKPNSGESGASSNNLGKIIMATQYDPDAGPFLNSIEMQNYDYANSTKPSCGLVHGCETAMTQQAVNMMYVRTAATPRDKIFTDLGKFIVATEGIPFATAGLQILGELWVTYRIKLSRATLYSSLLGLQIPFDSIRWDSSSVSAVNINSIQNGPKNAGHWKVKMGIPALRGWRLETPPNITTGTYLINVQTSSLNAWTTGATPALAFIGCSLVSAVDGTNYSRDARQISVAPESSKKQFQFIVKLNATPGVGALIDVTEPQDVTNSWKYSVLITQINSSVDKNVYQIPSS